MVLKASPVTSSRISRAILASWGVLGGTVISKITSAEVGEGVGSHSWDRGGLGSWGLGEK